MNDILTEYIIPENKIDLFITENISMLDDMCAQMYADTEQRIACRIVCIIVTE